MKDLKSLVKPVFFDQSKSTLQIFDTGYRIRNQNYTALYILLKMADTAAENLETCSDSKASSCCAELLKWKAISLTHVEYAKGNCKVYCKLSIANNLHLFLTRLVNSSATE